jgi:hypothetical protein
MSRKKETVSMEMNEAIQTLFDHVARLNDLRQVQGQIIYELCRAFVTVSNADPESLIQVIERSSKPSDRHPDCAAFVESLVEAIETEFIGNSDAGNRPKLRIVTDDGESEDHDPHQG